VNYGRELTGINNVRQETFHAALDQLGVQELTEFTTSTGYFRTFCTITCRAIARGSSSGRRRSLSTLLPYDRSPKFHLPAALVDTPGKLRYTRGACFNDDRRFELSVQILV
jgi:hypothetical protein